LSLLNKPLKIKNIYFNLAGNIRQGNYLKEFSWMEHSFLYSKVKNIHRNVGFLRTAFLVLFILITIRASSPGIDSIIVPTPPPYNPFLRLMYATGMVETKGNAEAYNLFENAVGIFQIRQVRVDEYNRRTGSNYKLADMFDYSVSEKVFLFFASDIGPYHFERIAKSWNGSGPKTEAYWKRIRGYLE
jgi:hypothetical protein